MELQKNLFHCIMADCSTPFPPRTKATDWASSILINISQFLGGKKGSGSALDWLICRSSHYDLKDIWKKPFPHNNYPSFLMHGYTYRFLQDLSRMAGHSFFTFIYPSKLLFLFFKASPDNLLCLNS